MAVVTFTAVPGTTYHIAADGIDGSRGNIQIGVSDEGGGDIVLPAGAVGIADFVNGGYKWGATSLVASDVVDHPEKILVGAGLAMQQYDSPPPKFIGDFATYLLAADWTVVLEWYRADTYAEPLHIQDSTDDFPRLGVQDDHNYALFYDFGTATERDLTPTHVGGTGVINVVAFTRTDAKLAASFNGAAVVSNSDSQTGFASAVDAAFVGGDGSSVSGTVVLSRIVVYPPQADADLPSLSVLSGNMIPPANDNFANAIAIAVGETKHGWNYMATSETGEPNHLGRAAGHSVWWKFTAPADGDYTVDLAGSAADADWLVMAIYTGPAVDDLTLVTSSGPSYPIYPHATFTAVSGVTYFIAVDGSNFGAGSIQIAVTAA